MDNTTNFGGDVIDEATLILLEQTDRTAEPTNTTNLLTRFREDLNQREISESTESINSILSNTEGFFEGSFEEVNTIISPIQESVTVTDMEQNTVVMPQNPPSYEHATAGYRYEQGPSTILDMVQNTGVMPLNPPSYEHATAGYRYEQGPSTILDMVQNIGVMPLNPPSYEHATAGDQYNALHSTSCQQFSANLRHSGDFAINLPSSEQFHVTSVNESENSGHSISSPSKFNKYFGRFILNYESLYLILGVMLIIFSPKSVSIKYTIFYTFLIFIIGICRRLGPYSKLMLTISYIMIILISMLACVFLLLQTEIKFASNLYSSYMFFDLFILVSTLVLILIPNKFNSEYIKYEYFKKYYKRVNFISCLVLSIFYISYNIFLGHFVGFFPILFDFQNILMLVLFVKNWNKMVKQKKCFMIYFVLLYFSMYLISIFVKAHLGSSIYLLQKIQERSMMG